MFGSKKKPRAQLTFLCCLLAMPSCVYLLDGISTDSIAISLFAGALLGAAYLLLRPLIKLLTLPVGCVTLGLFGFVIDSALIFALNYFVSGFHVESFGWAFLAALIVNGLCLIAA